MDAINTTASATASAPTTRRRRQRGASLLESLIAFVVLAGSTVTVGHLQGQLRLDGDLARQRSEAVRLGEEEIETLRAFSTIAAAPGARAYDAIADRDITVDAGNPSYRIVRRVDAAAFAGARSASVRVQWTDRSGTAREIALASVIAASDPAYAGALALGDGAVTAAPRGALGRAPAVPVEARDLGDGRSVWKPAAGSELAMLFDNASGEVVGRCSVAATTSARDLTAADLAGCAAGRWWLASGTIRFNAALPPAPDAANDAPLPVDVTMTSVHGSWAEEPRCITEARKTVRYVAGGSLHVDAVALAATPGSVGVAAWDDSGDRFVAWACLVAPGADARASGRAFVAAASGWTIGTGSGDRRVCRFAANPSNFLVIRGEADCPATPAVNGDGSAARGDLGTVAQQS